MAQQLARSRLVATTLALSLPLACASIWGVEEYRQAPAGAAGTSGVAGSTGGVGGESGSAGKASAAGRGGKGGQGGSAGMPSGGTGDAGGQAGSDDGGVGGTAAGMGAVGGAGMSSGGSAGVAGAAGTAGEGPCGPLDAEWDFENGGVDGFYHYTYPDVLDDNTFFAVDETDGSLRVTAGFDPTIDGGREQAIFAADAFLEEPRDLTGKAVFACVRLVEKLDGASGFPRTNAYIDSGLYEVTGEGTLVLLDDVETWQTIRVDIDNPAYVFDSEMLYDPTQVIRVGVRLETGVSGSYGPVVVAIGAVWIGDA